MPWAVRHLPGCFTLAVFLARAALPDLRAADRPNRASQHGADDFTCALDFARRRLWGAGARQRLAPLHHHTLRKSDAAAIAALLDLGSAAAVVVLILVAAARVAELVSILLGGILELRIRRGIARFALAVPALCPTLARVALVVIVPIVLRESRLAQRDRHR